MNEAGVNLQVGKCGSREKRLHRQPLSSSTLMPGSGKQPGCG